MLASSTPAWGNDVRISGQRFEGVHLTGAHDVGGVSFDRCTFALCSAQGKTHENRRLHIRDVTMTSCTAERGTSVQWSWLHDVTVRDLRIKGDVRFLTGCIFEHVILAGRIDRMVLDSSVFIGREEFIAAMNAEADATYRSIDWALDISAVETLELNVRNVPMHLVRRNPETQAVVRAENVSADWTTIDFEGTWFRGSVAALVRGDWTEQLLITPLRAKNADAFVRVIRRLREAGIADPE